MLVACASLIMHPTSTPPAMLCYWPQYATSTSVSQLRMYSHGDMSTHTAIHRQAWGTHQAPDGIYTHQPVAHLRLGRPLTPTIHTYMRTYIHTLHIWHEYIHAYIQYITSHYIHTCITYIHTYTHTYIYYITLHHTTLQYITSHHATLHCICIALHYMHTYIHTYKYIHAYIHAHTHTN